MNVLAYELLRFTQASPTLFSGLLNDAEDDIVANETKKKHY